MKALALLLLAAPLWAAPGKPGRELVHEEARFKMTAPKGWKTSKLSGADTGPGTSGAVFAAPKSSGPAARIVAVFYAEGNPHFKDAEDYLRGQTAALPVPVADETTGPIEAAALGGLPAKRLTRQAPAKGGAVRQQVTVLGAKGGFYALTCSGPVADWKRLEPLFKAALASFVPSPK